VTDPRPRKRRYRVREMTYAEKLEAYNRESCDLCGWLPGGLSEAGSLIRCRACDLHLCGLCSSEHEALHGARND
jgi:hypothetical protein